MRSACSRLQPSPNLRSITLSLTGSRSSACIEAIVCSTGWFVNFVCIVFLRLTSFEKQAEQSRKGKTRFDLQPPGYYDQNGSRGRTLKVASPPRRFADKFYFG